MGEAQRNPEPNKEPKEVRDFRSAYEAALDKARVSAEHTATEGWQNLYLTHREMVSKTLAELHNDLSKLAKTIASRLLQPDEERILTDTKRALVSLRETDEAFQRLVVDPVISPVRECDQAINDALAAADIAERTNPLYAKNLREIMETVIGTMPRVKFMVKSGRLEIVNGM
jgi:hypothetical protein